MGACGPVNPLKHPWCWERKNDGSMSCDDLSSRLEGPPLLPPNGA